MVRELAPIDISDMPELARLARAVAESGEPRLLRDNGTDVAVLAPAPARRKRRRSVAVSQADIDAALAASWEGLIDADQLKRELDEARGDSRPPLEL